METDWRCARRVWLRAGAAFVAATHSSITAGQPVAAVQETPLTVPDDERPEEEIVVIGEATERTSIDRTTYLVRDTALSRSMNAFELLDRIPSLEVTSGQLRLLGRSGVRILIDGNEVANPQLVLRNLQGSQVARIEVVSNPSAQFSAQGTAGIVNIILRRSFGAGLGGSMTASAGRFGVYDLRASPTWSRGRLSLAGGLGVARSLLPFDFMSQRSSFDSSGQLAGNSFENGSRRHEFENLTGNLTATYRPTARQSFSLTAFALESDGELERRSQILSSLNPGTVFRQRSSGTIDIRVRDLSVDYRREGRRAGEAFTVSAKRSISRVQSEDLFSTDQGAAGSSIFDLRSDGSNDFTTFRLDYQRPLGPRRLTLGAMLEGRHDTLLSEQRGQAPFGQSLGSTSSAIDGSWVHLSAYATYQFPLLGGTVLAGIRVEDRAYDIEGAAVGPSGRHLFPSLHLEREVARGITAGLSYSRRINWPAVFELGPALRFSDSSTANSGNASLRPEITDSIEGKLKAQLSNQNLELTLFRRRTHDLRSSSADLNREGVLIIRPVNLGTRTTQGLNLSIQGPLGSGFTYSVNGNVADEDIESGGSSVGGSAQYGASAQVEYRDGAEGRRNTDRVEIRVRYNGPLDLGTIRTSSTFTTNASWSHAFTDRLSAVLNVTNLAGAPRVRTTYFSAATLSRQTERAAGQRISVTLTYSLGPLPRR